MPLRFLQELKLYGAIYIEQHETTCVICTSVVWLGSPVPIGLIYHMALITTYLACLVLIWQFGHQTCTLHGVHTHNVKHETQPSGEKIQSMV